MTIHSTAIVDPAAILHPTVKVGPFCWIGPDVKLAEGVELISHVTISGRTTIGKGTIIYPFSSLGHAPQDLKYEGEPSELIIGSNNKIREYVTMQPGTNGGGMLTQVGDNGLFMVGVHVAHDCKIGDNVIMANNATLAGHVVIEDNVIIGGLSAVHQFVRIGRHSMIGGMSGVESDVIPYGLVQGERAKLSGLNLVGLKRRGFSREDIHNLRAAFRHIFGETGTLVERIEEATIQYKDTDPVMDIINFIQANSDRALCVPKALTA